MITFPQRASRLASNLLRTSSGRTCALQNSRKTSILRSGALSPGSRRGLAMASATSELKEWLRVSDEVADAVATNRPVVALESTIYTHGALGNELALEHEDLVRRHGGVPAIIAIVDGVPTVGVSPEQIVRMIESGDAAKVSRRDMSYLIGMVGLTACGDTARFACIIG